MITKRMLRHFMTLCLFAFFMTVCAMARPVFAQCGSVTDASIVADIYGKIKADKILAPQVTHINVVSVSKVVKFVGWADNQRDHDKIRGFANTECVRMVNINNFAEIAPPADSSLRSSNGCTSGTKPCGDICIPDGDSCNLGGRP